MKSNDKQISLEEAQASLTSLNTRWPNKELLKSLSWSRVAITPLLFESEKDGNVDKLNIIDNNMKNLVNTDTNIPIKTELKQLVPKFELYHMTF